MPSFSNNSDWFLIFASTICFHSCLFVGTLAASWHWKRLDCSVLESRSISMHTGMCLSLQNTTPTFCSDNLFSKGTVILTIRLSIKTSRMSSIERSVFSPVALSLMRIISPLSDNSTADSNTNVCFAIQKCFKHHVIWSVPN